MVEMVLVILDHQENHKRKILLVIQEEYAGKIDLFFLRGKEEIEVKLQHHLSSFYIRFLRLGTKTSKGLLLSPFL